MMNTTVGSTPEGDGVVSPVVASYNVIFHQVEEYPTPEVEDVGSDADTAEIIAALMEAFSDEEPFAMTYMC